MSRMVEPTSAMTDAPDDAELLFETFFEAEYPRLVRALYLITNDRAEAEDIGQEAMVRVLERWDRVRALESPTGYLFRTAINLRRSRLRRLLMGVRRWPEASHRPDVMQVAEARDELWRALASLPDGQREALVLVEWLGLTDEEAGRLLGIQPVSVRVRISRARATLREGRGGNDE